MYGTTTSATGIVGAIGEAGRDYVSDSKSPRGRGSYNDWFTMALASLSLWALVDKKITSLELNS